MVSLRREGESQGEYFIALMRERLTAAVESKPEVLLECDGGPVGLKADLYLATLYGFDDQVDAEIRIDRAHQVWKRPIMSRVNWTAYNEPVTSPEPLRTADYVLQSNYATMNVDWLAYRDVLPDDVHPERGTHLVTVALLRYRRRS